MKKLIFIALIASFGFASQAFSHSGRTDKKGGHNCSAKSKKKGLCSGYHYHNNGKTSHTHAVEEDKAVRAKEAHTH